MISSPLCLDPTILELECLAAMWDCKLDMVSSQDASPALHKGPFDGIEGGMVRGTRIDSTETIIEENQSS